MTRRDRMITAAEAYGYHGGTSALGTSMRHQSGNTLDVYDTGARHTVAEGHDVDQHACAHDSCAHVTHVYSIKQLRELLKKTHETESVADNLIQKQLRGAESRS